MASKFRKYGTCFFEEYAKISLETLLGPEFSCLVNRDRPDLQSPGDRSLGIEVTRAMEESKRAADELLKEISGIVPSSILEEEDLESIIENGYAYGLRGGKYIGMKELDYWSMALPLRRIIESKVSKAGNGFYGQFDRMGLYIFCKDPLKDSEAFTTCKYACSLQKYQDIKYNRLYLSEVNNLYVCNLDDGLSDSARLVKCPISQQQRTDFYLSALHIRLGTEGSPTVLNYR